MEEMEFEEMRNQISILKSKLDKQSIINDRLMRESMQTKAKKINANLRRAVISAIISLCVFPVFHYTSGISWALVAVTSVINIIMAVIVYMAHRQLYSADLMNGDVTTVSGELANVRRFYSQMVKYYAWMYLPWCMWFAFELCSGMNAEMAFVSGILCGVIGAFCLHANNKMCNETISNCNNLITQINDCLGISSDTIADDEHGSLNELIASLKVEQGRSFVGSIFSIVVWVVLYWGLQFPVSLCVTAVVFSIIGAVVAWKNRRIVSCIDLATMCKHDLCNIVNDYARNNKLYSVLSYLVLIVLTVWLLMSYEMFNVFTVGQLVLCGVVISVLGLLSIIFNHKRVTDICHKICNKLK